MKYKHFSELIEKMRLVVCAHNKISKDDMSNGALAYVTKSGSACYKIYTSEFCRGQSFLMHEIGHILFGHLRFEDSTTGLVHDKLMGAWKSFSKYISYSAKNEDRTMLSLIALLKNYAMDMEVNSKIFDKDEQDFLIEDMNKAEYKRLLYIAQNRLPGHGDAFRRLGRYNYARRTNPKATIVTPVFPETYGFPRGLSWNQYIDLIILAPDLVMPKIWEKLRTEQGRLLEQKSKIPSEVIRKAASNQDMIMAEVCSGEDKSEDKRDFGKTKCFTIHKLGPEVAHFITDRAIDRIEDMRTDYLYLSNRGKTSNILRGKTIDHTDYSQGNVYVIVDTSGSVETRRLAHLLDLFYEIKNRVGRQSKVIFWDSDLQRIDSLCDGITEIPRGGYTEIAPAIKYTASRFCSENDKLFIISDYCDFLDDWLTEIRKLRCSCYGICWTDNRKEISCLDEEKFYEFCKEVETLFVEL